MNKKVIYECEFCNQLYENQDECLNHELAIHLHITKDIYEQWEKLQEEVERCSSIVYQTNNEETRSNFDKAVDKIITFEKENYLPKMKRLR